MFRVHSFVNKQARQIGDARKQSLATDQAFNLRMASATRTPDSVSRIARTVETHILSSSHNVGALIIRIGFWGL